MNTRSLSISSFPTKIESSEFKTNTNFTSNLALIYYENPTKKVSALLQRVHIDAVDQNYTNVQSQWVDITSQESQSLPAEFRNVPAFDYSNTLYESESDTNATFTSPFTSAANFSLATVGALFHSPHNPSLLDSGPILEINYQIGASGPENFSTGMHSRYSYLE